MVHPPVADAAEDSVEVRLAYQKGIVLWSDRAVGVGEVERDAIVELNHVEMAEAARTGRLSISARNRADFVWSDDQTIHTVELGGHAFTSVGLRPRVS